MFGATISRLARSVVAATAGPRTVARSIRTTAALAPPAPRNVGNVENVEDLGPFGPRYETNLRSSVHDLTIWKSMSIAPKLGEGAEGPASPEGPAPRTAAPPTVDDDADLLRVLLENTRSNLNVRQAYARRNRSVEDRFFTYALLLQDGKIYVGSTNNIYQRLLDHSMMTTSSSLWVREHGPVKRVLEITTKAPPGAEAERTLEYMSIFGWEAVRGGGWCKMKMSSPPASLEDFTRGQMPHNFLPRSRITEIWRAIDKLSDEMLE